MNHSEFLYCLALTQVPHIGDVHARILLQHFGSAAAVFRARPQELERLEGIGTVRASAIRQYNGFETLEPELRFIERYGLRSFTLPDPEYPQRLLHCYDPPALLFGKGDYDLNRGRFVAIVGTRNASDYGRQWTERFVKDLAGEEVTIVSGLAFGVDACAHKAALKHGLPTIGVVAHGLGKIYPHEHMALARDMVRAGGGLLTEFFSGTKPDKHHFPLRNRIVAGLCDATVVVETAPKGGSMITARLADGYNRDVFAVPGRVGDRGSGGCHQLIRSQKAQLLTEAAELIEAMGWRTQSGTPEKEGKPGARQKELFLDLSAEEQALVRMLAEKPLLHVDELNFGSGLSPGQVSSLLLQLELKGVLVAQPGKLYRLS